MLANLAKVALLLPNDLDSEEDPKLEHLKAPLMMEFNPSEQIRAHRRTERTITTLASKLWSPGYWSVNGESIVFVETGEEEVFGGW